MRILMSLHASLTVPGGATGVTCALGETYRRAGHEVHYHSFDDLPGRFPAQLRYALFASTLARRVASLQRSAPLDIIDASTGDASVLLALKPLRRTRPAILTRSHGLEHTAHAVYKSVLAEFGDAPSWKYPLYHGGPRLREVAYTLRHSDEAMFLNECDRQYAVREIGVAHGRTTVLSNGIDDALLGLAVDYTTSEGDALGIAQIGSYLRGKGIKHGADALGSLLARRPEVHVTFLGTGCDPARVLADFAPVLHDRIRVVPRYERGNLPQFLDGHQIKFFPTYSEGCSLALLEAMACGLAPVTTDTPGTTAVVTNDETGLIVPPRDAMALMRAVDRLADDRQLLARLRRAAHRSAQRYRWSDIADETLAIYARARQLGSSPGPRTNRA